MLDCGQVQEPINQTELAYGVIRIIYYGFIFLFESYTYHESLFSYAQDIWMQVALSFIYFSFNDRRQTGWLNEGS